MSLLCCLIVVMVLPCGYFAQILKQAETSVTKVPGKTGRIKCETQNIKISNSNPLHWYQQKPGQQPTRVLYYGESTYRDPGFGALFKAGKNRENDFYLTIDKVKPEDAATYYCAYWDTGYAYVKVFGTGTKLIVTDKLAVKPTIRLFPPNSTEMKSKKKALVVCLLTGFFPEVIRVEWTIDGEGKAREERVFTDPVVKQGNDAYSVISRLEVTELQWESKNINCKADHEGGSGTAMINKDYKTDMKKPSAPTCPPPVSEAAENASEVLSEPPLNALQVATFTYTLLLMKSVVYCGIISFVLYRVEYRDTKKPL
ncbi:immunoglobulin lambda-1 light chain-like isoform X1 [Carcharodon carcharias]|uniref:immunoglobulin lambda-1 light chain-like isoform X1 n=1 Tax=Carcharodon carcharias TaxID=13397 RepID=UPI001B7DDF4A|nr:immunoglobulin lambda-1 light chain-like isoform X1 [Carcharodon carcharias]